MGIRSLPPDVLVATGWGQIDQSDHQLSCRLDPRNIGTVDPHRLNEVEDNYRLTNNYTSKDPKQFQNDS